MTNATLCATALVTTLAGTALGQATFTGIGDLAGGASASFALGLSADGTKVVGSGTAAGDVARAILWSAGTMTAITDPAGTYTPSAAHAIADNGVIVGVAAGPRGPEAFKYNTGGGNRFRPLGGTIAGGFFGSAAWAVSASGGTVVGSRENDGFQVEAARWDGPGITGLGFLDLPAATSKALGISADGTTIVGGSDAPDGYRAFVLGADGVMHQLPFDQATESEARAVSSNGTVIVGEVVGPGFTHAVRWTGNDPEDLGVLPGGFNFSTATDCSADGSVVVGRSSGPLGTLACVWRPGTGLEIVETLLKDSGLNLEGWSLTSATGVSADGRIVCGTGINPEGHDEGWIATLPSVVLHCPADFNGDLFVDFFDYDDFVNCFETGTCPPGRTGDFNGDGFADFFDYDDFVGAFENGC